MVEGCTITARGSTGASREARLASRGASSRTSITRCCGTVGAVAAGEVRRSPRGPIVVGSAPMAGLVERHPPVAVSRAEIDGEGRITAASW